MYFEIESADFFFQIFFVLTAKLARKRLCFTMRSNIFLRCYCNYQPFFSYSLYIGEDLVN
jgi:hypothetical protein